ncbi:MAG: cation transporter [Clostridiales bacterium]|nr:cation transporter [Clostridiales bacterium]
MVQITVKVDGMQCGMCEAHVNDAIRQAFKVKKVSSSHSKGETVVLAEDDIDEQLIKAVIDKSGYKALSVKKEPYEKKGLFSSFRR